MRKQCLRMRTLRKLHKHFLQVRRGTPRYGRGLNFYFLISSNSEKDYGNFINSKEKLLDFADLHGLVRRQGWVTNSRAFCRSTRMACNDLKFAGIAAALDFVHVAVALRLGKRQ